MPKTASQKRADRAAKTLLQPPEDGPRILLYDIETMAALIYAWGIWDVNAIDTKKDWYMLSFAYKWLGQDEVGFVAINHGRFTPGVPNGDDTYVVDRLHALFDMADVIVAHNGDRFDKRKANARFLLRGHAPPSPYRTIDTKKEYKRYFADNSNSLNEIARQHSLGEKVEHPGFVMWRGCEDGEKRWWDLMEEYNRHDIFLLEGVYNLLLPWMGQPGNYRGVNYGFWAKGKTVCPNCGSTELTKRGIKEAVYRTYVSEFQVFQCRECHSYGRARARETQAKGKGVQVV